MTRLIMEPKEVQIITQKSEGYCRKIIRTIKKELSKAPHQKITVTEFCAYYGLDVVEVQDALTSFYFRN